MLLPRIMLVAIIMKCEHRVVFSSERARSQADLYSAQMCLSNIHVIVCREPRWAWIYSMLSGESLQASLPGCFGDLEWLCGMFLPMLSRMGLGVGFLPIFKWAVPLNPA